MVRLEVRNKTSRKSTAEPRTHCRQKQEESAAAEEDAGGRQRRAWAGGGFVRQILASVLGERVDRNGSPGERNRRPPTYAHTNPASNRVVRATRATPIIASRPGVPRERALELRGISLAVAAGYSFSHTTGGPTGPRGWHRRPMPCALRSESASPAASQFVLPLPRRPEA
ncbi:hypothetical protein MRX96_019054 [Rhipicephalus microplus]